MMLRLNATGLPPARSFVSDGGSVPSDECCNGVAWVRVAQITPTDADGNTFRFMWNAPTPVPGHSILLEAGVLRCTPTLDELGNPPSPEEYTAAAQLVSSDRLALRLALLGDFPTNIIEEQADGQIPGVWTPVDAGGCGGGYITTEIGTSMVM